MKRLLIPATLLLAAMPLLADDDNNASCTGLPTAAQLKAALVAAPNYTGAGIKPPVGGLFNGTKMWAAVVNRSGVLCASVTSTDDPTQVWPGSQAIAKSKAYTGNAFSLDNNPLSTAMLYTLTQPGHSLWSLGQSNLFDTRFLAPPSGSGDPNHGIPGGLIFFGGGVPLYKGTKIVGALGVSGDTSCADHEVAKRVRHILTLDLSGNPLADDIVFTSDSTPASVFSHPKCPNTYRNGTFIGNENPPTGY
jgi:uncharacterized protein GlcG (DUF336 family)